MKFKSFFENYTLNGEYWITNDGFVMYADGDVGDYNHEGYVINYVQNDLMNHFGVYDDSEWIDWDEIKQKIASEIIDDSDIPEELEKFLEEEGADSLIERKLKEDGDAEELEKLYFANGFGDAREYAIMKWGWKRVAGNDIESAALTSNDMQTIASGLYDIDDQIPNDATFFISVYGGQNYEVTLAELESGRIGSQFNQSTEIQRRQQNQQYSNLSNSANKQVRGLDIKAMHPYYQNKTFPIGDWKLSFKKWKVYKEGKIKCTK